jgi:hypothetical protein
LPDICEPNLSDGVSWICAIGVAYINGCVGLQEPSALETKLAQFGSSAEAGEIAVSNSSETDPTRTNLFIE